MIFCCESSSILRQACCRLLLLGCMLSVFKAQGFVRVVTVEMPCLHDMIHALIAGERMFVALHQSKRGAHDFAFPEPSFICSGEDTKSSMEARRSRFSPREFQNHELIQVPGLFDEIPDQFLRLLAADTSG
ncbi:hypothetical protein MLD38_031958 [Melastoma candidum]|uniref:Uncharacterized protein n=1 Tax=Melastoma candidum TaxID=119954 RepID=A0ACB9MRV5_9MYRT|nr:hypothetical protein MLD38_031958 [Melastoma candidum]